MKKTDEIIHRFVTESNAIEGICHEPTKEELSAHLEFIDLPVVTTNNLSAFVASIQPGAVLRSRVGPRFNVQVGEHVPPPGGPEIREMLEDLLERNQDCRSQADVWRLHLDYETLHPFTDGNGRSGRALWARSMYDLFGWPGLNLNFLHRFYYQTLQGVRANG